MNLVGKRVRIRDESVYRGRIGKCVEYVPGYYVLNGVRLDKPQHGATYIDAYYVVEVGETCIKCSVSDVRKPWIFAGLLHFLFKPWR